jgi:sulfhydrogenase subunit beta (sulfur reductase)
VSVDTSRTPLLVERADLHALFDALIRRGYRVVGPTVRDGAIVNAEIFSVSDLPDGLTAVQEGGSYRIEQRKDHALFGFAVGPNSSKQFLHPAARRLWSAGREGDAIRIAEKPVDDRPFAFIGLRSCDLHALEIQERVLGRGPGADSDYRAHRGRAFVVAVNCGTAGGTCFCTSMGTGPKVTSECDLKLTELLDEIGHEFLVEVESELGAAVMGEVPHRPAHSSESARAEAVVARTAENMGRVMDTTGVKELLYGNLEHARWSDVASRCLSCGNCTMVCPTCFCSSVEDSTSLDGEHAERRRVWDSCFTTDFSFIHGGAVRPTTRSRYRQWMTHKLATWIDQFGTSGCVGCGRCITWCPVGIDITAEVAAIRASDGRPPKGATDGRT